MNTLSVELARTEWPNILQDAIMGVPSLITKAGLPIIEVRPIAPNRPKPVFGCARGQVVVHDDFDQPLDDFKEYML
jgi:antitoxin (DNA-binding transcriptional repressor) of toxin-antitoxin stability system